MPSDNPGNISSADNPGPGETLDTLPSEDLTTDRLLRDTGRMRHLGREMPVIAGIPLFRRLGEGGMGAVYYGVHLRMQREVAVKVMLLRDTSPEAVRRFGSEARIGAKIDSSHLVKVYDINEEKGLNFMIMEFVRGGSAANVIKTAQEAGAPVAEVDALDLCIAATEGLRAAHILGVIHRDIKPANILVPRSKDGVWRYSEAKLADLGLARYESAGQSLTADNIAMGTPGYMAPEQAQNAKGARKPADVFSVGATLYALLGGRAPFTGESITEILLKTVQQPHTPIVDIRPDVSPVTRTLIDQCLAKDPARRFIDASALLDALKVCRSAIDQPTKTQLEAAGVLTVIVRKTEVGKPVVELQTPESPPTLPSEKPGLSAIPAPAQPAPNQQLAAAGRSRPWILVAALILLALAAGVFAISRRGGAGAPMATVAPTDLTARHLETPAKADAQPAPAAQAAQSAPQPVQPRPEAKPPEAQAPATASPAPAAPAEKPALALPPASPPPAPKTTLPELQKTFTASLAKSGVKKVAVLEFIDETAGAPRLGGAIGSAGKWFAAQTEVALASEAGAPYKAVERSRVDAVINEIKFQLSDLVKPDGQVKPDGLEKFGKVEPVDAIVLGTVRRDKAGVQVTIKALRVPGATIEAVVSGTLALDSDLAALFGESFYIPPGITNEEPGPQKVLALIADGALQHPYADAFSEPPYRVEIIEDGAPLSFYKNGGQIFVPARAGKSYSIRMSNNSDRPVVVALLIDGLNSIGQRREPPGVARKWVLDAGKAMELRGWQMDLERAREFVFAPASESLAARQQFFADVGQITAAFYRQRRDRGDLGTTEGAGVESKVHEVSFKHEDCPAAEITIRYDREEIVTKMERMK